MGLLLFPVEVDAEPHGRQLRENVPTDLKLQSGEQYNTHVAKPYPRAYFASIHTDDFSTPFFPRVGARTCICEDNGHFNQFTKRSRTN